ncbi:MAG TPA: glycosyl hydrolase family 8 [Sphingomonas sp.]|nr:glycosyl hydrolase family 8 [Sphingomonas sp.]
MPRRAMLAGCLTCAAARRLRAAEIEWDVFKSRFLTGDGRILDTGNRGISHTEGQGWGLLFAEHHDDPAAFERIYDWIHRNLRRPDDALHAWRYDPAAADPVSDGNNAADGDLFIGMALSRAARRWRNALYAARATRIAQDIRRLLVREIGTRAVLLPGYEGFEGSSAVVVNPSYYAIPAIRELADRDPSPVWQTLVDDGQALFAEARFGKWSLVPDWLQLEIPSGKAAPAANWPPRFSFDAVRLPLYLNWGGCKPDLSFKSFALQFGDKLPAWVDLVSNEVAPYIAPPGVQAVRMFATATVGDPLPTDFPTVASAPDYYSAALTMLVRLAWWEAYR